jgi:MATE family multidrug resistance protein
VTPRSSVARLLRLAAPVAVGRLGVVGMGVVDAVAVGQLAPAELAHQALGWTINGPALIGGIGLLLGVQVLTARSVGAGRAPETGAIWRRGLAIAAAAGALVSIAVWALGPLPLIASGVEPELARASTRVAGVLSFSIPLHLAFMASTNFLEGLRRPAPGAIAMWAANAVNLALNLALVPRWGAVGSAWATVLSRAFLAAALGAFILLAPSLRPLLGKPPGREPGYRALLAIGAAAAVSAMVEAGAFATMSVVAGRIGATAVATFSVATGGLVTLVYLLAQGLATAGAVVSSEAIGAGEWEEARRAGRRALLLSLAAMAACGAGCALFAEQVARAFSSDPAILAAFAGNMGLIALLMVPDGGQGVADALLRARGENWLPTLARITPFAVVAPPLALYLSETRGWALTGVFAALLVASILACAALCARFAVRPIPRSERG